jgi:hypothetical protein
VFNAPIDLVLEETSVVQPDLVIVGAGRASIITERALEGVPGQAHQAQAVRAAEPNP